MGYWFEHNFHIDSKMDRYIDKKLDVLNMSNQIKQTNSQILFRTTFSDNKLSLKFWENS